MGTRVLFIYPNTYGMNMLLSAIALFSAILKNQGHKTEIFDITYYATDYGNLFRRFKNGKFRCYAI